MGKVTSKIVVSLLVLLGLSGCEGKFDEAGYSEPMKIGEEYTVYAGDKLTPTEAGTNISVVHTVSDDVKKVVLTSGKATLLRGDYKLNQ